ncbi:MAG: hypothetical protein ACE5KM_24810, partial [Planctomycetaceae bacterium]
ELMGNEIFLYLLADNKQFIARVDPGGPSFGHLLPGDQIMGLNGSLLSLSTPIDDLRRLVTRTDPAAGWVFRIERQGRFAEVAVPVAAPARSMPDPSTALRQLRNLFQGVDFGSIRAVETAPDRVSADLRLRFTAVQSRG